ncbi:hypothetical protein MTP99_004029 [Tenebrio molitor]|nr:hypothetical protein MTP99_004029 [Tenebrio molitor]
MDYDHHNLLNYDYLYLVRVLGSDIYLSKCVKFILKLTFTFHMTLLVAQLYFFLLAPSTTLSINYRPPFLQIFCINCAVVFVEGIYFVYSFSLFLANLNDIVHLTKKSQSFEEFGEPRDLASFKNQQNKLMKFLYVNSVGGLLGYSAWSYLEEPTCRRTSFDHLDNPLVKNVVLVVQTFHIVLSLMCAITATCFIITCIDLITLKMHLNENLESVKELPQGLKKEKLVWCVNYHVHIIGLTEEYNNIFSNVNAVHFILPAVVMALLIHQVLQKSENELFQPH